MNQPRDPNLTDLDNDVGTWCAEAEIRISKTGKSHKLDVDETHEASKREAMDTIDYVSRRLSSNSDPRGETLTQLMNMEKENPDQDGVESDDNEDEIGEANTSNDTNTNT